MTVRTDSTRPRGTAASGAKQPFVSKIREEILTGLWCVLLRALRECEIASLLRNCSDRCPDRERVASFSPVLHSWFALCKACRHPLVLGTMIKRGEQPGAGMILADINNSRCGSLIGCYGISGHTFIASDNLCERIS